MAPALRDALVNQLSPASFAWVVAAGNDRWIDLPSIQALAKIVLKREDLLPLFSAGRVGVIGLSLEPDPVLRVVVKTDDARAVGDWFARRWADERTTVEPGDEWAIVTTPCPLAEVANKIAKLIPPAKK